jgi:hypothetical protein
VLPDPNLINKNNTKQFRANNLSLRTLSTDFVYLLSK